VIGQAINVGDLFSIAGKIALVTGGSRGIGLMIARGYVEAGAKVYISSRKKEVCDETARQLSEIGDCISLPADLSNIAGCQHLADEIREREPALHILVNNAGANWGAPLEEYPEAGWDKVMDTNVKGIFFLTQQLLTQLEAAARPGAPARVINIGSIDGIQIPFVDNYAYSASKAAVHHLTRVLAVKLGPRGVAVNAVAPGFFPSKMNEWLLDNFEQLIAAGCPLQRKGVPADMAGVAIYLGSRAGAYVNGAVITIDGGTCLK
jgi:NAD(P)-dependent dehydrogenase (short-subunit alcohol dehydrogenase family)